MPILVTCRVPTVTYRQSRIRELADTILSKVGEAEAELSLELVGTQRMRRLNREFRQRDTPTDVLAFPLREAPGPSSPLLGDVVIALPVAMRQAAQARHSLDQEVIILLVHGVLHLCGYDHQHGEAAARQMRRKERAVLKALGPIPRVFRFSRGSGPWRRQVPKRR